MQNDIDKGIAITLPPLRKALHTGSLVEAGLKTKPVKTEFYHGVGKSYSCDQLLELNGFPKHKGILETLKSLIA